MIFIDFLQIFDYLFLDFFIDLSISPLRTSIIIIKLILRWYPCASVVLEYLGFAVVVTHCSAYCYLGSYTYFGIWIWSVYFYSYVGANFWTWFC